MVDTHLTLKLCKTCGASKPRSEFHKSKSAHDGLCSRCKPCNCAHVKKARDADPERTRQQKQADYQKHKEKRLQQCKDYRQENRDACLARSRARDKQKLSVESRAYYLKNADRIKKLSSEWAKSNPDKRKKIAADWHERNRGMKSLWDANRRANEKQATPSWSNSFFIAEAYSLAKLREKVCGGKWHVDHIVPLQSKLVCGLHVEANLQVIPGRENLRKSNRHWPDMP